MDGNENRNRLSSKGYRRFGESRCRTWDYVDRTINHNTTMRGEKRVGWVVIALGLPFSERPLPVANALFSVGHYLWWSLTTEPKRPNRTGQLFPSTMKTMRSHFFVRSAYPLPEECCASYLNANLFWIKQRPITERTLRRSDWVIKIGRTVQWVRRYLGHFFFL